MNKKIHNIYNQPKVKEVAPGEFSIDTEELGQFYASMDAAKDEWDAAMSGAEMDPDEIMRRMMKMFEEE